MASLAMKTPLNSSHHQLGALMVNFAGWQMPLHYGSTLKEHHYVRNDAGIFDVSHMAVVEVSGPQALDFLRVVCANDPKKITNGQALYGCLLNEQGGILDDLITYRLQDDRFMLVVNASRTQEDIKWLKEKGTSFSVSIQHRTSLGILAVQGPFAREKLMSWPALKQNDAYHALKGFHCMPFGPGLIARTGYTGEDGVELILSHEQLQDCWTYCLHSSIWPIGLGARDSLRLEAGLNLYGKDMDASTTPYESNLGWTVDMTDPHREFIGKTALLEQKAKGISRWLKGVVFKGKGVLREGMVLSQQEAPFEPIATLTSGGFSPTLNCSIGMARCQLNPATPGYVQIRNHAQPIEWVKMPFVKNGKPQF